MTDHGFGCKCCKLIPCNLTPPVTFKEFMELPETKEMMKKFEDNLDKIKKEVQEKYMDGTFSL